MNTCPRCHRPLEDEEPYVCCAGQALAWRCTACGKVSEGFAFPYGLCPLCGDGRLALAGPTPAASEAALEAVRSAFEIELGGMAFYARAAQDARHPALRELFERLAGMEREHMATLSRRYHVAPPDVPPGFDIGRVAAAVGVGHRPEDPVNLFRVAIAFEKRAVAFFTEAGERTAPGSPERALYAELAAEEREHVALLTTELGRHQTGLPGLL